MKIFCENLKFCRSRSGIFRFTSSLMATCLWITGTGKVVEMESSLVFVEGSCVWRACIITHIVVPLHPPRSAAYLYFCVCSRAHYRIVIPLSCSLSVSKTQKFQWKYRRPFLKNSLSSGRLQIIQKFYFWDFTFKLIYFEFYSRYF